MYNVKFPCTHFVYHEAYVFRREAEMTEPAIAWLKDQGLLVKKEYFFGWGYCDLVAMSFCSQAVQARFQNKQTRPVGGVRRIRILHNLRQVEGTTYSQLVASLHIKADEHITLLNDLDALEKGKFIRREDDIYFRLGSVAPLERKIVAVELKLKRVMEVLGQAESHLYVADESYAALPKDVAERAANSNRYIEYFNKGVGLLAVTPASCSIVIPSHKRAANKSRLLRALCAEKFWRTTPNKSLRSLSQ